MTRYKAVRNLVVGGKPVKAGETFQTPAELVEPLARGMVVKVASDGRRKKKK
jgi:hypothetical protein